MHTENSQINIYINTTNYRDIYRHLQRQITQQTYIYITETFILQLQINYRDIYITNYIDKLHNKLTFTETFISTQQM